MSERITLKCECGDGNRLSFAMFENLLIVAKDDRGKIAVSLTKRDTARLIKFLERIRDEKRLQTKSLYNAYRRFHFIDNVCF